MKTYKELREEVEAKSPRKLIKKSENTNFLTKVKKLPPKKEK